MCIKKLLLYIRKACAVSGTCMVASSQYEAGSVLSREKSVTERNKGNIAKGSPPNAHGEKICWQLMYRLQSAWAFLRKDEGTVLHVM